ncbi:hypothetical protein GH714_014969 [Hevea brasiliensis]|uniref:NAC domain-containing protein n=1 Tax=Hevea brasiliensis TaxID=3981 RepID=A0A6A6KPT6_HEVBR|nr:hypothetical protein GH714_014969 [Hevea brasiliensis]
MDEAKFLKASGTLPETPSEIRKASEKLKGSAPLGKDLESSDFHSWLPNTSIKKLQLNRQIDQLPTPVKLREEWGNVSVSLEHTPISCISDAQNTGKISISSVESGEVGSLKTATDVLPKNKSVRFECNLDTPSSKGSSSENGCHILRKFESTGDFSVSKPSPKPTPLKLSDEMQTPGTVFPTNVELLANGKTRIRSQYVYPVLNPVENASQWKGLQEDDSSSLQLSSQLKESSEQLENSTAKSAGDKEASSVPELKVEASLSSWFKPRQSVNDNDDPNDRTASSKNFRFGKTPTDRPIIGMVAAHWNENEPSHISQKWWDGNGIPNSTNKYKEDQKVSWHATPFEERLEKALSEESFISQKKDINGRPLVFNEHDESDTALSKNNKDEEDETDSLPGFRFHPTDEELVGFYLRRKVENKPIALQLIKQIDIYKYDPWELPTMQYHLTSLLDQYIDRLIFHVYIYIYSCGGSEASIVVGDNNKEWYFFCIRGRKYRNSVRPNRVTGSGFWKATGIDKPIYSSIKESQECIGLKKSLVYYRGSAGKGTKTDWMMHEFRLPPNTKTAATVAQQAEVWTLCRIFKRIPSCKRYTPVDWKQTKKKPNSSDISTSKTFSGFESENSSDQKQVMSFGECLPTVQPDQRTNLFLGQLNSITHQASFLAAHPSSWNPNADDFFANGNWDELRTVVEQAVDPKPYDS